MYRREYGEKVSRPLFSWDTEEREKLSAYEAIDQAPKGTRFLRVTVSPDPKREDTNRDLNLRELTNEALKALAGKYKGEGVLFFAAVHEGHTDNRHVNLLVILPPGRLTKHHWKAMRTAATKNALDQRQALDQERGIETQEASFPAQARIRERGAIVHDVFSRTGGSSRPEETHCPVCFGELDRHGRVLECGNCELSFSNGPQSGLQIKSQNLEIVPIDGEGRI
jgi:hypothetical protein